MKLLDLSFNKPGIRENASNEDTGPEFHFAKFKPEGAY